jgi:erythromycin esterase
MWANEEIAEFIEWLKAYNAKLADGERVGFYGLDVYSL